MSRFERDLNRSGEGFNASLVSNVIVSLARRKQDATITSQVSIIINYFKTLLGGEKKREKSLCSLLLAVN